MNTIPIVFFRQISKYSYIHSIGSSCSMYFCSNSVLYILRFGLCLDWSHVRMYVSNQVQLPTPVMPLASPRLPSLSSPLLLLIIFCSSFPIL